MQIPIPDDWDGVDRCEWAVCWPNSSKWKAILFGLLASPSQGRFWDITTGYIKGTQEAFRPFYEKNFTLSEVLMSCNDSGLQPGLEAIASAIIQASLNNNGSSGSSGGCSCVNFSDRTSNVQIQNIITLGDGTQWPIFSSGPLPELPESGFPEGYEDLPEYDADKCAKANKIVSDLSATLHNMANFNLGVGVIGAIAILACIVGLIVVPQATIPLLLFAMVGNVGITTALGLMAEYVDTHVEELVCILYEGENIETIINLIADFLDIAVASLGFATAIAIAVKSIVLWLLNGDSLAYLFTHDAANLFPTADCASCIECVPEWFFVEEYLPGWGAAGTGDLTVDGEERVLTAVLMPNDFYYLLIGEVDDDCPTRIRCIDIGGNNDGGSEDHMTIGFDEVVVAAGGPISSVPYTATVILG